jgi:hypothetical protein
MPITINGSGTIGGLNAGGLPDGSITTADLDSAVPVAKAWVNFNGTGTVAIRASYNVSSITDNGVGLYTLNFTTAMVDGNYCGQATNDRYPDGTANLASYTTTSVQCINGNGAGTLEDRQIVSVAIFR